MTELFGPEQVRLAVQDWLDELVLMEALPGLASRDWRLITIAASARLANRVNASSHRVSPRVNELRQHTARTLRHRYAHWHFDHTDGNTTYADDGTNIIAHCQLS